MDSKDISTEKMPETINENKIHQPLFCSCYMCNTAIFFLCHTTVVSCCARPLVSTSFVLLIRCALLYVPFFRTHIDTLDVERQIQNGPLKVSSTKTKQQPNKQQQQQQKTPTHVLPLIYTGKAFDGTNAESDKGGYEKRAYLFNYSTLYSLQKSMERSPA